MPRQTGWSFFNRQWGATSFLCWEEIRSSLAWERLVWQECKKIRKGTRWKLGDHSETLQLSQGRQFGLKQGIGTQASGGGCGRGGLCPMCLSKDWCSKGENEEGNLNYEIDWWGIRTQVSQGTEGHSIVVCGRRNILEEGHDCRKTILVVQSVMCCLMMGLPSEKCVIRQFGPRENIMQWHLHEPRWHSLLHT